MKNVTIARVPGQRKDMMVEDGCTVRECARLAGIACYESDSIMINGRPSILDAELRNGDIVTISAKVKGNMPDYIDVTVARVPGERKVITLNGGRTVRDALGQAGMSVGDKDEMRVNNRIANLSYELRDGDVVTLTTVVKGN